MFSLHSAFSCHRLCLIRLFSAICLVLSLISSTLLLFSLSLQLSPLYFFFIIFSFLPPRNLYLAIFLPLSLSLLLFAQIDRTTLFSLIVRSFFFSSPQYFSCSSRKTTRKHKPTLTVNRSNKRLGRQKKDDGQTDKHFCCVTALSPSIFSERLSTDTVPFP